MNEQTVKCPICGKPYVVYAHYAGDQSACPKCRAEARETPHKNWEPFYPSPKGYSCSGPPPIVRFK